MENTNNVVNEEIKEDVKADTVEVKTFTQEEVDKMISKRLQRERKDIKAQIEAERKEAELKEIIETENLKEEETRRFISDCFANGEVKTTGTDINKILPPTSRFGGGNRGLKKQTVLQKILTFFERFFGV